MEHSADYVFHEKASQVFDSRTSIFMGVNLTAQSSGSGSQPLRMDTTKTVRRRGLAPSGAGFYHTLFLNPYRHASIRTFIEFAFASVHIKIRRQELQSIKRTRYSLSADNQCKT